MKKILLLAIPIFLVAMVFGQDEYQSRRLFRAIYDRDVEAVENLIKQGAKATPREAIYAVNGKDGEKFRLKILTLLLDNGTDVKGEHETLIRTASKSGTAKMVALLLDRGANPEATVQAYSPLYNAILWNGPEVVRLLLDRGASAYRPCAKRGMEDPHYGLSGTYPLHLAAYFERMENVRVLLDHGAPINLQDNDGESALHSAALNPSNAEIIKLLLKRGADKRLRTKAGETAEDIARRKRDGTNLKALRG